MRTFKGVVVSLVMFAACDSTYPEHDLAALPSQVLQAHIVGEEALILGDTVALPDLLEEHSWFQLPRSLHRSRTSNHLWAIERSGATLIEFTTQGTLVRKIDRHGQGPQELQNPQTLVDTDTGLLVLDPPARRISALTPDGAFAFDVPLESAVWDFDLLGAGQILAVPGEKRLVDVYEDKIRTDAVGPALSDLMPCRTCLVKALPDGRVLVVEPETPRLFLIGISDGSGWKEIDLRNEVLSEWQQNFSRWNPRASREWIGQVVDATADEVRLLVYGLSPDEDGSEIWKVDLDSGAITRQRLAGQAVQSLVALGDEIFALLREFRTESMTTGETVAEGTMAIVRFVEPGQ